MLKKISLVLRFETEDSRADIVEEVLRHFEDAVVILEGEPTEQRGYVELEDCGHNVPNSPCVVTDRWEVGRGKVR